MITRVSGIIILIIISLLANTAFADTIANRLGFSGRIGAAVPVESDSEFINGTSETKAGFAANGGLIYGFGDYLAAELDVTYLPKLDVETDGIKNYEATLTDIALGLQYRITPKSIVVPYIGIGADFIKGGLKHVGGKSYTLDWTYGGHANAGLDWFLTKGIALTADIRMVRAVSGDILSGSTKVSEYDPFWVQGTVGVRLILPKEF